MSEPVDDAIDFSALSLDELYEQMGDDLYDGLADEVVEAVNEALRRGQAAYEVMTEGLVAGMDIVGEDFRDGILFVPEVLMAAKAMKSGMAILRPLLAESGAPRQGTLVIGTVKGDIHDIGQNLVSMMLEGAGFEVINLGINVDADKFLGAIREHQPDIIGMSALLTTTMPYMKVVVDRLKEESIRDDIIVMIGGAPVTQAFADHVGADGYGEDAAAAVELARKLVAEHRKKSVAA
jgi:corrinoid protein of di/trimethylamine methyltransferase